MSYEDNSHRTVVVVNKKHNTERGATYNAVCHALLGLANQFAAGTGPEFLNYVAADAPLSVISRYPVIILEAENSNQLRVLIEQCRERGIAVNPFVSQMFGASADEQMRNTRAKDTAELDFVAVALYGALEATQPITKRFSLLK